ncbi:MAG: sulfurtransferase complex subunit TusB [Candidatus Lokiarchaeota archaeon]|nr:sulfurtransferase complex subunit TusB [Candidatus Lokiarchaeota archaeon]
MKKVLYFISAQSTAGVELALENKEDEVSILLLQNAVYCGTKKCSEVANAIKENKKVYVLKEDVELRGIQSLLLDGIEMVDYNGVIDVTFAQDTIVNF